MSERWRPQPVSEPTLPPPPILEPNFVERMELSPFKPSSRQYWMDVGGGKCQWEYYEGDELRQCNKKATEVHHIIPEGWQLQHGDDPEHSIGLPLCDAHHSRNSEGEIFEQGSSMHPDVSNDFRHYGQWKEQARHMKDISGRRSIDYSTSPFAETAHEHHDKSLKDERYWSGTEQTDDYYIRKMQSKELAYRAKTGKHRPTTEPHPRTDSSKKKHWWDETYEKKGGVTTETRNVSWNPFKRRR